MTSYIPLKEYQQDEKVLVITESGSAEGRVIRVTPHKDNYAILSVLTDTTKELITVQRTNKVSKLN